MEGVGLVRSAFLHEGVARVLVHHLKYRGVVAAATILAGHLGPLVDRPAVLVPVPRLRWRQYRYGVDPAVELAHALGRSTGLPVERRLAAPWFGPARAGGAHGWAPEFRARPPVVRSSPVLLVDDVVTTGATLAAASRQINDVVGAVTATTSVGTVMFGQVGRERPQTH